MTCRTCTTVNKITNALDMMLIQIIKHELQVSKAQELIEESFSFLHFSVFQTI